MDQIFYTNAELTEKSGVPQGSDLPQVHFELLEFDLSSLPSGLTIYDIEWLSEGVVTDLDEVEQIKANDKLRAQYKSQRDASLIDAEISLDGMIFQTRPNDFINFTVGIDEGSTEWILKNDSIAKVTTEQLEQVLALGKTQSKLIFDIYMDNIKSI